MDGYQPPPPPPLPPRPAGAAFDPTDLTSQFEQLLRTRRLNELSTRSRSPSNSRSPSQHRQSSRSSRSSSLHRPLSQHSHQHVRHTSTEAPPPLPTSQIRTSPRNYPKMPTPPQDERSWKFRNKLVTLSHTPMKYENPGLLDDALKHIPLDRIYGEAEDESNLLRAEALSLGPNKKPEWGYQDCVIRSLLK